MFSGVILDIISRLCYHIYTLPHQFGARFSAPSSVERGIMIDLSNPMDCAFILLFIQVFGIKWMLQATDGLSWGMTPLSARGRTLALAAGLSFIWIPYVAIWVTLGHTPLAIFNTIVPMWQMGYPTTYATAILVALCMISLPQALVASFLIRRAREKELAWFANRMQYLASDI